MGLAGVGGISARDSEGGEHRGGDGLLGSSWGSTLNAGTGGKPKLRSNNMALSRETRSIFHQMICKMQQSFSFISPIGPQHQLNESREKNKQPNRPWCQEGVCWSRSERLKLEGWQAIGSLEGETFGSKWWIFNRFHSRDVVCLNFIHLGAQCQAWGTRLFLLYLQLLMIRFQQRTDMLLFIFDSHALSIWKFRYAHLGHSWLDKIFHRVCILERK